LIKLKIPKENLFSVSIRISSQGQFAIGYHHAGDIVDEVLADELNRRIAPLHISKTQLHIGWIDNIPFLPKKKNEIQKLLLSSTTINRNIIATTIKNINISLLKKNTHTHKKKKRRL